MRGVGRAVVGGNGLRLLHMPLETGRDQKANANRIEPISIALLVHPRPKGGGVQRDATPYGSGVPFVRFQLAIPLLNVLSPCSPLFPSVSSPKKSSNYLECRVFDVRPRSIRPKKGGHLAHVELAHGE